MQYINAIVGTDIDELRKIWDEVTIILIDRYNIGVMASMSGPTGLVIVNGQKRAIAARSIPLSDRSPRAIAAVLASQRDDSFKAPLYVAPYQFIENVDKVNIDKKPDVLRIGFVFENDKGI